MFASFLSADNIIIVIYIYTRVIDSCTTILSTHIDCNVKHSKTENHVRDNLNNTYPTIQEQRIYDKRLIIMLLLFSKFILPAIKVLIKKVFSSDVNHCHERGNSAIRRRVTNRVLAPSITLLSNFSQFYLVFDHSIILSNNPNI